MTSNLVKIKKSLYTISIILPNMALTYIRKKLRRIKS